MAQIATVRGTVHVPGDKSISHRALILSAFSNGTTRISHLLDSADVRSTAGALRALGAAIPPLSSDFVITSKGTGTPLARHAELDCGNSGTTARLLAGVVAGSRTSANFIGDASLSRRPMLRVAEPLRAMGARVDLPSHGGLPMTVSAGELRDVDWSSPIASAQVKSALLLAALLSGVSARITEPNLSRDHTERMLAARGVTLISSGSTLELPRGQTLQAVDVRVPGDPSSAAYFIALGLLADRGEVRVSDVCLNETRTGFLDALLRMGGDLSLSEQRIEGEETIGTVAARPSQLQGIAIAASEVPAMIDELPLLACVAARAAGETVVEGASELRVKESDRISAVVENLKAIGGQADERVDGFRILGGRQRLQGRVRAEGDHRIAMAFGILGAIGGNHIDIDDRDCVKVSYPDFWTDLQRVRG